MITRNDAIYALAVAVARVVEETPHPLVTMGAVGVAADWLCGFEDKSEFSLDELRELLEVPTLNMLRSTAAKPGSEKALELLLGLGRHMAEIVMDECAKLEADRACH